MTLLARRLYLVILPLFALAAPLRAFTIHIVWDQSVTAGYFRIIPQKVDFSNAEVSSTDLSKDRQEDFSANLPEGNYLLRGPSFNASFQIRDGKVLFREEGTEAAFSNNQGKIIFNTATLKIDLNGYEQNVAIEGVTSALHKTARTHTLKVICGRQKVDYGGGILDVALDADGKIRIPDNPGGFIVQDNTVIFQPREYIIEPDPSIANWTLGRNEASFAGAQKVKLLPTTASYALTLAQAKNKIPRIDLRINDMFQLSTAAQSEFAEYVEIRSAGASNPVMTISLPDGKEIVKNRQVAEFAARQTYQVVSHDSLAHWHQDFTFDDAMQIYPFPEQLLTYRVKFPVGKIRSSDLALLSLNNQNARSLPLQLSDMVEVDGFLNAATLQFRGDLPMGQKRLYRLTAGYHAPKINPPPVPIRIDQISKNTGDLLTDVLRLHVPTGRTEFKPAKPLTEVPAPILGFTRLGGAPGPALTGAFVAPSALQVETMESRLLETGPLLARYRISYRLEGNKSYEVTLTLRTAESYLTVDENMAGFAPADEACWRMRFASLRPTLRQALAGSGYARYSGPYEKGIARDGRLPVTLGLFTPNSIGVMRSAAFWDDKGSDALVLSLNRLRDWKTAEREVWSASGLGMIRFFCHGDDKYFQARLEGTSRYWALGLIPREAMVNRPVIETKSRQPQSAGPEIRLWEKLSDLSLDVWKDRVIDFDEKLDPGLFADKKEVTYDEWMSSYSGPAKGVANQFWDSDHLGAVTYRGMPTWFGTYAKSRAKWTPEQRRRVRAILLLYAYCSEDDNGFPHHSMLAGHPNFISDVKLTVPLACATFPNHPDAKQWRDSFLGYFTEWLSTYQRSARPEYNARGGRWVESIACYSGQSLVGLLESHKALAAYDGTDLINSNPRVADWVRWYRDVMMSPHEGVRLVPPQGAHARGFEPDFHQHFRDTLFEVASLLVKSNPRLASEMLWIKTNGKEGVNPKAASCLYTDYGPVFHYDLSGPNESYATLQNISGRHNYRWQGAGIIYYGAKGKAWSFNGAEDNGDDFSWDKVSAFSIKNQGLKPSPTDQLLYDFGFAQFYRARGEAPYLSRGLLLVRDDYLVLYDEVDANAPEGQFVWSSSFQMPEIYQLKPGVTAVETTSSEGTRVSSETKAPSPRISHQRKYIGKGDFLTIVAPTTLQARAQGFGATVNGEYVLLSPRPLNLDQDGLRFSGTAAYARTNQLALFEGTLLALNGMVIQRHHGEFGLCAVFAKNEITGRFVGRSGGHVSITPPPNTPLDQVRVYVAEKPVEVSVANGLISFAITMAQRDGLVPYRITCH